MLSAECFLMPETAPKADLPKSYEPAAIEARWAEYWVKEKLFSTPTPAPGDTRPVFTLLLPPPNVTGRLHMGHMLNQTQMDIIVPDRRASPSPQRARLRRGGDRGGRRGGRAAAPP